MMTELLHHLSEKAVSDYDRLRDDAGLLNLGNWSLLRLSGEDRKGWLQGQVTSDVRKFANGLSTSFCICSATGQIQAVVDSWADSDFYWLTCESSTAQAVLQRVEDTVIIEDVEVADLTGSFSLVSVQGPTASRRLGELFELPKLDAGDASLEGVDLKVFRSKRTPWGGWDLWVSSGGEAVLELLRTTIPIVEGEAFEIARIEAGIPRAGADFDSKTLAPELGGDFVARHISYTKGCYTGQEVLMRIHSRGHTNKSWIGLVTEAVVEPGSMIGHTGKENVGHVTSSAFSPDLGPIAAAMVRNEFANEGQEFLIHSNGGLIPAEGRRMPMLRLG